MDDESAGENAALDWGKEGSEVMTLNQEQVSAESERMKAKAEDLRAEGHEEAALAIERQADMMVMQFGLVRLNAQLEKILSLLEESK